MTALFRNPSVACAAQTGIKRAAVIGAGSMGSGIAAQFANAGVPVDLLDVAGSEDRNGPARAGIERQLKTGGFMHPGAAGLVRPGNVEDNLERLGEADWIVEAVIERLDVKRELYLKVDAVRKPGSIVSSNTSTIPRGELVGGLAGTFAADFLITHFFNPPRVMRLVEIVSAPENPAALVERVKAASTWILGKTVVDCRDTPGFIANRIGCFWLAVAALEARKAGLRIEEADAAMAGLGIPRTGAFGLLDLVGIDLVPHVWGSLMRALPASDAIQAYDLPGDPVIRGLIEAGRLGRKAKAGFYRVNPDKSRDALDLASGQYRSEASVAADVIPGKGRDAKILLASHHPLGDYAWRTLARVIAYAAEIGPDIAADVASIDTAIELGYAWKEGPFRLADRYGVSDLAKRLAADGETIPPLLAAAVAQGGFYRDGRSARTDGTGPIPRGEPGISLSSLTSARPKILGNRAASLWDVGDGVACFEIHTKMNALSPDVFEALAQTLETVRNGFRALVIGNDDPRAFSAGADLTYFVDRMREDDWPALDNLLRQGKDLFLHLKYAPFPVVVAASGLALGGGCELMLHCDAVVAHAELNAGLPEARIGILPGWGGCAQLLLRTQGGTLPSPLAAFDTIQTGIVSSSALDALDKGLLRESDPIVMSRDQVLGFAIRHAAALADAGYNPPDRATIKPLEPSERRALARHLDERLDQAGMTPTDALVAEKLAFILTGGDHPAGQPLKEEDIMALEREAVIALVQKPATRARIEHMLATGKALRN
ncbi:3-hydroxyacyl-CoA dehydrogenase/enoyl-CoA hydratase family protein [Microvirga pudoricolor]|uniref:3-hydroxyacyl-CoA dehydrogenase/enoyl-CoA hydratase family protein n=1 Tax=Microvirga pudoricolor TaxID=2778729 RepID=UPI001950874D|nr:3-hydroxyacyl-CoA dehydrogenase/enoyl-CoA hydratase family protein [Microvirga pudoricolor]MBM6592605.1 3-hydroxyacyl-CoA dehydrogenase/enoyl-CoA hydratase family protein [Microvirga pudoricolor]